MVTKAYLDAKLLPSLERVLKEVGPDSLYEALRTAYPDASLPPISNIENIEIFVQFGGGSISPLFIEYSHDDEASTSLDFEPVAVRKDDVSAAIHAAIANVAGLGSISGCGGLIQTTSG
jgi:hypothetical protein